MCVGLMDGSIKVINPPSNQIISVLASQETARYSSLPKIKPQFIYKISYSETN